MKSILSLLTLFVSHIKDIYYIVKNDELKYKHNLISNYIKISLLKQSSPYIIKHNDNLNILNYKIKYLSYPTLITTFREVFIKFDYFFKTNIKQPFIVDCGSNIGLSILFFKMIYPHCRIIAFEPDEEAF